MKILFAVSEAQPFISSGGLADVAGALPKAIRYHNHDCRVVLPLYRDISNEFLEKIKLISSFYVQLSWRSQYCGIYEVNIEGVIYYLLDNKYYFDRDGIYGYYDDAERFAFFSKAVLEMIKHIDFVPEIIHCNDWQSALVPVYFSLFYRGIEKYSHIKTVFTIHNIQYQGKHPNSIIEDVFGIPHSALHLLEWQGCLNLMKGAIEQCDYITTVSKSYAEEILDPWFSEGLDALLNKLKHKLIGITNGIDIHLYNPQNDNAIFEKYGPDNIERKSVNKSELEKIMGISHTPKRMLVGIVSRLVPNKGMDLIECVFGEMIELGLNFVILGSGNKDYEGFFSEMVFRYPGRVAFNNDFNTELSRKIFAGADVFLMPSRSEPCGIAQLNALRYGAIPIVRSTGGLKDTIKDLGEEGGNGFTFLTYNAHDMLHAVNRAKKLYGNSKKWKEAVVAAINTDVSWSKSASKYIELYQEILGHADTNIKI